MPTTATTKERRAASTLSRDPTAQIGEGAAAAISVSGLVKRFARSWRRLPRTSSSISWTSRLRVLTRRRSALVACVPSHAVNKGRGGGR